VSLADDIRLMIGDSAIIDGSPTAVTLASGAVVQASANLANEEDALGGDAVIAGRTRVLAFAADDVPGLASQQTLTWNSKSWRVVHIAYRAQGNLTRAFLGAP